MDQDGRKLERGSGAGVIGLTCSDGHGTSLKRSERAHTPGRSADTSSSGLMGSPVRLRTSRPHSTGRRQRDDGSGKPEQQQGCATDAMKPTASTVATLIAGLGLCRGVYLSGGPEVPDVTCPSSCAELFGRLEEGVQEVEVQLRGEPKSGTGTNGEWAWGGLAGVCIYLQNLYGERSWNVETEREIQHKKIVFQPQFDENAPCDCGGVQRVEIGFSTQFKHTLPVDAKCTFSHRNSISKINHEVCRRRQGLRVEDGADLWRCVEEADCAFNDDRLQLAVMRDPRAVTVSSYFHRKRVRPDDEFKFDDSVDNYFQNMLGHVCMWTTVRHLLFTKVLADRSELFLFEDMLIDPVDWFGRFFPFVGLQLPVEFIFDTAEIAGGGGRMFGSGHEGSRTRGQSYIQG